MAAHAAAAEHPHTDAMWRAGTASILASERHPFLLAMVDGTLPLDRFRYYATQDSLYLTDFAEALRVLARGVAEAGAAAGEDAAATKSLLESSALGAEFAEQSLHTSFFEGWGAEALAAARCQAEPRHAVIHVVPPPGRAGARA